MRYCFLRYPGGKFKAVTLSYDDGTVEDMRLAETLNRYGLKCTFNLVGSWLEKGKGLTPQFVREEILGKGHEVANHGYEHRAQGFIRTIEGVRDVLDSRLYLEKEFGLIIRGMAQADRTVNRFRSPDRFDTLEQILSELDIAYARAAGGDNDGFALPENWLHWTPTAHHGNRDLMAYIDKFLAMDEMSLYRANRDPKLFYLWGHAFEFERTHGWDLLEQICQKLSGHEEIWYATNMEIYEYVNAWRSIVYSADGLTMYNPTLFELWFDVDGPLYTIKPGQTLKL